MPHREFHCQWGVRLRTWLNQNFWVFLQHTISKPHSFWFSHPCRWTIVLLPPVPESPFFFSLEVPTDFCGLYIRLYVRQLTLCPSFQLVIITCMLHWRSLFFLTLTHRWILAISDHESSVLPSLSHLAPGSCRAFSSSASAGAPNTFWDMPKKERVWVSNSSQLFLTPCLKYLDGF